MKVSKSAFVILFLAIFAHKASAWGWNWNWGWGGGGGSGDNSNSNSNSNDSDSEDKADEEESPDSGGSNDGDGDHDSGWSDGGGKDGDNGGGKSCKFGCIFSSNKCLDFPGYEGPTVCTDGEEVLHLEIDVLSDNKFASNAFKLIDECTGEIIDYQCFKDWGRRVFEFDYCLPRYAKYKFVVLDEYGKSFWSPYSEKDGKYTLTVDGVKIAIERDCKGSSPVRFGDGCDVPPPPPPPKDGGGMGDPHIKSWNGKWYDFHGQCDLVMVDAPDFNDGEGLLVHIRTKLLYEYSYIEGVAIKIGDKILEVSSYGDYLLNGIVGADMPNKLSDSVVNYYKHSNHEHIFQVILSEQYNTTIEVSSFKSMLSIKFMNATEVHFGKSAGLMGEFGTGKKYARDGVTVLKDMDMFGQEWQVLDSEPKLFETTNRAPQHPQKCLMPEVSIDVQSTLRGRRLGESITKEAAQKVCADWKEDERDACIFDVIATGDLEMAQAGGF